MTNIKNDPVYKAILQKLFILTKSENYSSITIEENNSNPEIIMKDLDKNKTDILILEILNDKARKGCYIIAEALGYYIFQELDKSSFLFLKSDHIKIKLDGLKIDDDEIKNLLINSNKHIRNIPLDTDVKVVSMPAYDLLNAKRFDIAIKTNYARLYKNNCAKKWREKVYYEQALRITGPSKIIKEYDGTGKEGIDNFIDVFHSLINENNQENIPLFPIDKNGVAMDGAHRISSSIANNNNVDCVIVDEDAVSNSSSEFFRSIENGHVACPEEILDEAAIEYCLHKNDVSIVIIFPVVVDSSKAIEILSSNTDIVYKKDILLTAKQGGNLLRQLYMGQAWLDWDGDNTGFEYKKRGCFPFAGKIKILLIDNFDIKNMRSLKEEIRDKYKIGNHSIHVTDGVEETLRIARLVFNKNSIDVVKAGIGKYNNFHQLLFKLKDWMVINNIDENHVCVDSSSILSVLGLREGKDIDFLYHGDEQSLPDLPEMIECHNNQSKYYEDSIDEMIGNPELHFWYMGVKFCSPEIVYKMKIKRGEAKDIRDARMLKSKISGSFATIIYKIHNCLLKIYGVFIAKIYIRLKMVKSKLRVIRDKIKLLVK